MAMAEKLEARLPVDVVNVTSSYHTKNHHDGEIVSAGYSLAELLNGRDNPYYKVLFLSDGKLRVEVEAVFKRCFPQQVMGETGIRIVEAPYYDEIFEKHPVADALEVPDDIATFGPNFTLTLVTPEEANEIKRRFKERVQKAHEEAART
jgi:hypothetical protein